MKFRISNYSFSLVIITMFFAFAAKAQTEGTLTFTFTETVSGATKNIVAVWIEDNSGTFIKTKMRFGSSGNFDHLPAWVSKSAKNVADAVTGATLTASTNPTAFGVKTVVWDGKNAAGTTVADGTYKILVETAWKSPEPPSGQHSGIISFTFEKSAATAHITPAGNANFSNVTIDWVPAMSSIETPTFDNSISVYPNPSRGLINLDFNTQGSVSRILVENISGEVVYQETLNKSIFGKKSLDVQQLSGGIYILEILSTNNSKGFKTKIVINK